MACIKERYIVCIINIAHINFLIIIPLFSQVTQWEVFCRDVYYTLKGRWHLKDLSVDGRIVLTL